MIVISDTSPIIYFSKIDKMNILRNLYSILYIPNAVWEELIYPDANKNEIFFKEIEQISKARKENWLIVRDPDTNEFKELAMNYSALKDGVSYEYAPASKSRRPVCRRKPFQSSQVRNDSSFTEGWGDRKAN